MEHEEIKKKSSKVRKLTKDIENKNSKFNEIREKREEITPKLIELTNRYYELIPQVRDKTGLSPIDHDNKLKQQYRSIEDIGYVEEAVKILLGALLRQHEINPLDYCYKSLDTNIWLIEKESLEYNFLSNYIKNTQKTLDLTIVNIYGVDRHKEKLEGFSHKPNHLLLFHGSKSYNFLGILSQVKFMLILGSES